MTRPYRRFTTAQRAYIVAYSRAHSLAETRRRFALSKSTLEHWRQALGVTEYGKPARCPLCGGVTARRIAWGGEMLTWLVEWVRAVCHARKILAAQRRVRESFGHRAADGSCLCVYCTRDAEGLADLAAEYELELHALRQKAVSQ